MRHLPTFAPITAITLLGLAGLSAASGIWHLVFALGMVGGVIAAIHHAEVVAHRVGEPYGTIILALAITIIETALILSLMLAGDGANSALPRDAIFSALMIICSGVIGMSLFVGGLRHVEQRFRVEGSMSSLAALVTLAVLSLILPNFTTTTPDATYSNTQLAVIAALSLVLWAVFIKVQTGRHRDYFLPAQPEQNEDAHAEPPTVKAAWQSAALLFISLIAVVGLAKILSKPLEQMIADAGAPKAVLGVAIALLVLLPETGAAIRAARANRFQSSMNLALGSALASIGLTIPAVAVASMLIGLPLELGLEPKHSVLMCLTFAVNGLMLGLGRSNILLGVVHLVLFAAFLLISIVP